MSGTGTSVHALRLGLLSQSPTLTRGRVKRCYRVTLTGMDERRTKELVLWFAMVLSMVVYAVITLLVPVKATGDQSELVAVLLVVAIGAVTASLQLKKLISDQWAAYIVALVLSESAALLGVILWFVAGSDVAYVLIGIGIAGLLLHFPKADG